MKTTTALATIQSGERGLEIRTFQDLKDISSFLLASGLAPRGFETAPKIAYAIQRGLEIGLPPLQALESMWINNGKVAIYGDAVPALIYASGKCGEKGMDWGFEGRPYEDSYKAWFYGRRSDNGVECRSEFSVADAKKAGLWGKKGPWTEYTSRQMMWRAKGFGWRDLWPDVLRGLVIKEELDDYPDNLEIIPRQPRRVSLEVERVHESGPETGEVGGDVIETGV